MPNKQTKRTYSAENVAKYLIFLASKSFVGDNKEREGITNLKLQKVLYFAQAYYLANFKKPLFKESIEAWKYGPVVPSLYHKLKRYKSDSIITEKDESSISEEDKNILQQVWNIFGGYSTSRLVDIVHAHTPWKESFESDNKIISNKAIKEYYSPLLSK